MIYLLQGKVPEKLCQIASRCALHYIVQLSYLVCHPRKLQTTILIYEVNVIISILVVVISKSISWPLKRSNFSGVNLFRILKGKQTKIIITRMSTIYSQVWEIKHVNVLREHDYFLASVMPEWSSEDINKT